MKDQFPNTTRKRKEIIKDHLAYIDSTAKEDHPVFEAMLMPGNESGNAIRVHIGGSTEIPVRALGYVASALRVAQLVPVSQVQIVSVANLASRINGVDIKLVREQFLRFARISKHVFGHVLPEFAGLLTFVEDTDSADALIDEVTPTAKELFTATPKLMNELRSRGEKHGGNPIAYAAAHFVYQDTKALEVARVFGPQPIELKRVLSIGCLQEKKFFESRLLLRNSVIIDNPLPNVQAFTLHTSAPYFPANGGEQLINDISQNVGVCFDSSNPATQRDLNHLKLSIGVPNHE